MLVLTYQTAEFKIRICENQLDSLVQCMYSTLQSHVVVVQSHGLTSSPQILRDCKVINQLNESTTEMVRHPQPVKSRQNAKRILFDPRFASYKE